MATQTTPEGGEQSPAQPTEELGAVFPRAEGAGLGLAGFATTTFILSMIYSGLAGGPNGVPGIVAAMSFAVGGIAQFLAGIWELRNGSTFAGTAFAMYGMFWLSFYFVLHVTGGVLGKESGHDISLYLWAWAIFTGYMTLAAVRTNGVVLLVFILLTVTFVLLAIANHGGSSTHPGGFFGLATAIVAWYGSCAIVLNETWGKAVLPLFPLTRS